MFNKSKHTKRKKSRRKVRLEKLHSRQMMAADAGFDLPVETAALAPSASASAEVQNNPTLNAPDAQISSNGGVLTIRGGSRIDRFDDVRVYLSGRDGVTRIAIEVNTRANNTELLATQTFEFLPLEIREIKFYGYQGNDKFKNETFVRSTVDGGDGDDYLVGGTNVDRIVGGAGNDTIFGEPSRSRFGSSDHLSGGSGNDSIIGFAGNDTIFGGHGDDSLSGGAGHDRIYGDYGVRDTPWDGRDVIKGGTGHDILYGGGGNDIVNGNDGNDQLSGQSGDDAMVGGKGDDTIFGGRGNDLIEGDEFASDFGNDRLFGGSGNDRIRGQNGNDYLWGGSGRDIMNGGDGDDELYGGTGRDSLYGGKGRDLLDAGRDMSADTLDGGAGSDRLIRYSSRRLPFSLDQLHGLEAIDRVITKLF